MAKKHVSGRLRVVYDHQVFSWQTFGGVSRYYCELMREFRRTHAVDFRLGVRYSNNAYLNSTTLSAHRQFFKKHNFRGKAILLGALNRRYSKSLIARGEFDIFHPTFFDPYFLNLLGNRPFVMTVYDLNHDKYPSMFPPGDTTARHMGILIKRAAKIIAISENTKMDLVRFCAVDPKKIQVIYLAGTLDLKGRQAHLRLPTRYILFVGSRAIYKNFLFFIRSVTPILQKDRELKVICAGGGSFSKEEQLFLDDLEIAKQVLYYPVNDAILRTLYRNALVFVFPSLYEGFGLPVLEAFACQCPTIVSHTSSFPEVAGEAAVYLEPSDPSSVREAVKKVINSPKLRAALKAKGRAQLKKFSWAKTARETKKLYGEVLG